MKLFSSLFAALLTLALSVERSAAAEPPNILFIVTDDQAAWTVGASRNAHPNAHTPNIDRLYREGAYLPNAFTVTPVCSPSRAALLTGRYGSELGITDWINPQTEPDVGLASRFPTWPRALRESGYTTGLVGKSHWGIQPGHRPVVTGYDYFMGFLDGGVSPQDPSLMKDGTPQKLEGFTTDILTDHAISFIRERKGKRFCLSLHYRSPHAPYLPVPESDWAAFKDLDPALPDPDYPDLAVEKVKKLMREYLASIAGVDHNVGRLLALLDELGIADNTVVVFTSDHGYNLGHHGIWHKGNGHWLVKNPPPATEHVPRGQRPNLFDHSIRVPLTVRWPAAIKPSTVVEETVTMLDWFPTLLAVGGVEPTGDTGRGRDFLPLLRGEKIEGWDNDLFIQYSIHNTMRADLRGYRTREWKLVRDFLNEGHDELYHLAADPEEKNNLIASSDPGVVAARDALHGKLLHRMREIGDALPQ